MVTLITAVVLGVIFAIFSTQNTGPVTLNIGGHILQNIPVYLVILVPLLSGLLLAFLFHITKDLSQNLTINEQKDDIKKLKNDLAEVTKQAHKFELESTKLKEQNGDAEDEDSI